MTVSNAEKICEEIVEFIIKSDPTVLGDLNCSQVALKFGINRCYLSTIFKEYTGEYLKEYIKRLKILRFGLLLLERRDLPVKKIAVKFGYESLEYFTRIFKEFFAVPPSKFKSWMV